MPHRTDAAGRTRIVVWLLLCFTGAGCATLAKRDSAPPKNPPPAKTAAAPPATKAPALAITTPPRLSAEPPATVQPVSFQTQATPPAANAPVPPSSSDPDPARRLYRDAAAAYAKQESYIARLKRREAGPSGPKPDEVLIFRFREQPYSVHFKWLGEVGKGREVLYVRGQNDDKLHVLTAAGDIPLMPAGRRLSFAPDSTFVRAASQYPITEAGIGSMIARFGKLLDAVDRQELPGLSVKYIGPVQRPEYPTPLECVECQFPPDREPKLPQGGKRVMFFDPATKFPVVTTTFDTTGREVDYFCFDLFQLNVRLDDDDFQPEKLWGPTKPSGGGN